MWKDPVVEEVRAIRDAYAKQFKALRKNSLNKQEAAGRLAA